MEYEPDDEIPSFVHQVPQNPVRYENYLTLCVVLISGTTEALLFSGVSCLRTRLI